ncbi:MAG: lysine--tRNA ligase, partial [Candidatus Woesearchaeota archaeon]
EADEQKLRLRAECAKNWIEKYAPDDFKFFVNDDTPKVEMDDAMRTALKKAADVLDEQGWEAKDLHKRFYDVIEESGVDNKEFFRFCYNIIISKDKGPKLASFILSISKEKVARMFREA